MKTFRYTLSQSIARKLWLIIFLSAIAFYAPAQEPNRYYLYVVPADDSVKPDGNNRTMGSPFLDSIFDHFEVTAYEYAFPGANNPRLAITCEIHASGDIMELKTVLDSSLTYSLIELAEYYMIPIGIEDETPLSTSPDIYPNPASSLLYLVRNNQSQVVEQVEIYDLSGKRIQVTNNKSKSDPVVIDISDMPKGIYLLKVYTKDETATRKLVIH